MAKGAYSRSEHERTGFLFAEHGRHLPVRPWRPNLDIEWESSPVHSRPRIVGGHQPTGKHVRRTQRSIMAAARYRLARSLA
jgi:hypothetical protein